MTTTPQIERERILASFPLFGVPPDEQAEILEALDSPKWDWFKDCDGCTCVSEDFWPTKYFPPCLRHDFDWQTGGNVYAANARFYRLSRRYGFTRVRAAIRWLGVTLGWLAFFKWRAMFRRAIQRTDP